MRQICLDHGSNPVCDFTYPLPLSIITGQSNCWARSTSTSAVAALEDTSHSLVNMNKDALKAMQTKIIVAPMRRTYVLDDTYGFNLDVARDSEIHPGCLSMGAVCPYPLPPRVWRAARTPGARARSPQLHLFLCIAFPVLDCILCRTIPFTIEVYAVLVCVGGGG